mgnify:CR=1 FL=1
MLRKRQDELQIKLSDCDQIKKLVFNFDVLLSAYKLQIGFNEKPDFDKILLARHLSRRYPNSFSVLTLLVDGFKDKIIEYLHDNSILEKDKENNIDIIDSESAFDTIGEKDFGKLSISDFE